MPAKGYRKGVSDALVPLAVVTRTRLPVSLHGELVTDAKRRRLTVAKLLRAIVEHHYRNRVIPRVRSTGPAFEATRELNRLGVNLNQLTHLAHTVRAVPVPELQNLIARIEATLHRL
jgi:hypothetical protein